MSTTKKQVRSIAEDAINALVEIVNNSHANPDTRIRAAGMILERVKPYRKHIVASKNWRPKYSKYPKVYGKSK